MSCPAYTAPAPATLAGAQFIGHDRELGILQGAIPDLCAGRGRLLVVSGEAGISKTRLAEECSGTETAGGQILSVLGGFWTALVVPPATLSGRIHYYVNDLPVAGATLTLRGAGSRSAATAGDGAFAFDGVVGDWTLDATKAGIDLQGVSALDASHVLQAALGMRTFSSEQSIAGDVTGNGTISALDASRILQYRLGIIPRLPIAQLCNAEWLFLPSPMPVPGQTISAPALSNTSCVPGVIGYTGVNGAYPDQNFIGILFGDVTGNWQPPTGSGGALVSEGGPP